MNPSDEQDDLWKLLGKVRPPTVSQFFARNAVREVRGLRRESLGFYSLLRDHWRLAVATVGVGCIAVVAGTQFIGNDFRNRQIDSLMAITQQVSDSPDFYVINDLDDLLASEESSVWLDSSVR